MSGFSNDSLIVVPARQADNGPIIVPFRRSGSETTRCHNLIYGIYERHILMTGRGLREVASQRD